MSITLVNAALFERNISDPIPTEPNGYLQYNTRLEPAPARPPFIEYKMCAEYGSNTIVLNTWASTWSFAKGYLMRYANDYWGTLVIDGVTIFDDTDLETGYLWTPVDGSTITFSNYAIGGNTAIKMEVVTPGGGVAPCLM